jgi:hypothetical protein
MTQTVAAQTVAAQTAGLTGNVDLYLHVRVLVAIILGLSVTRLISGVATLIQHPGRYPSGLFIWAGSPGHS